MNPKEKPRAVKRGRGEELKPRKARKLREGIQGSKGIRGNIGIG